MADVIYSSNDGAKPAVAAQPRAPAPARGISFARGIPNLLAFALLASVLYLGHHTGWRISGFGELFQRDEVAVSDWCAEHLVTASKCVECDESILPRQPEFGFCKIHGVAECVICHPELGQQAGPPQLPKYDTAQALALVARRENNSRNLLHKRRVQFVSAQSVEKAGIDVDVVQERPMKEVVSANGEIVFDPTRVAHLSSRANGTVTLIFKHVGDRVAAGEVLALVDAVQVGQAKSQLLQAIVKSRAKQIEYERLKRVADGVAGQSIAQAKAAVQQADVDLISARQALVNLGLELPEEFNDPDPLEIAEELRLLGVPRATLDMLPWAVKSANLIAMRAPHPGVVVTAERVAGEVVDPSDVLFTLADPGRLWLTLHVRQDDARYVALGQQVEFRTDDGSQHAGGQIAWISPAVDARTRTLQVRLNLDNPDGKLKDNTFGSGQIILREEPNAVVVPRDAVHSVADAQFVFVRGRDYLQPDAPKIFYPRQVRTGATDEQFVELLAGVLPGEVVATTGSPMILAQLLRGSLGDACGCYQK